MKTLESLSEERNGYFTWESLAARFTERTGKRVCYKTVYNSCKAAGWRAIWTSKVCMPHTLLLSHEGQNAKIAKVAPSALLVALTLLALYC